MFYVISSGLKHFFKIYVKGFDGAADLRAKLYACTSTDEIRQILDANFSKPQQ